MKITKQTFIDCIIIEKMTSIVDDLKTVADDFETLYHQDITDITPGGVKALYDIRTQARRIENNIDMILKFNTTY